MPSQIIDVPVDGFELAKNAAALLVYFIASAFACLGLFSRLDRREEDLGALAGISAVVGPMLLAWLLAILLTALPGRDPAVYLGALALIAGAGGAYGAIACGPKLAASLARYALNAVTRPLILAGVIAAGAVLAWLFFQQVAVAAFQPVYANDSLEYLTAGRLVAESADLNGYPFLDGAATGGFISPWTHPPSFIVLNVLAFWIQGSADMSGAARFISTYFFAAQAVVLFVFVDRGRRLAGPLAAAIMLATPIYFLLSMQAHVDSMRMAAFAAAAAAAWIAARRMTWSATLIAGIAVGMAHFSHSIGFLTLGFLVPFFLIAAQGGAARRVGMAVAFSLLGVLLVAPFALKNLAVYGSLAQDTGLLWSYPQLRFEETLALERGIETVSDKILYGALRPLTQPEHYGLSAWALAAALVATLAMTGWKRALGRLRDPDFRSSALFAALVLVGGFFAFLAITIAAGTDLAIKNIRYVLTIQPFVAIALAHLLTFPLESRVEAGA
jgi:4-amino-4-deoxy-L-arabinose transferase-like glycosyltransferase